MALRQAERLVRTETSYISNQADMAAYRQAGVERYLFVTAQDSRTCPQCGAMDAVGYAVDEAQAGVNLPPMHPWCRCTTVAVVAEGKGLEGKGVEMPQGMTFEEWRAWQGAGAPEDVAGWRAGNGREYTCLTPSDSYAVRHGENSNFSDLHQLTAERKEEILAKVDSVLSKLPASVKNYLSEVAFIQEAGDNPANASMALDEKTGKIKIGLEIVENVWYDSSKLMALKHMNADDPESLILMHEAGHIATYVAAMRRAGVSFEQVIAQNEIHAIARELDIVTRGAYIYAFPEELSAIEIIDLIKQEISLRAPFERELIAESVSKVYYGNNNSEAARKIVQYITELVED